MEHIRLPEPAHSPDLQLALTRALDSVSAYLHAATITPSQLLSDLCRQLAMERNAHAQHLGRMIERAGGIPHFKPSLEAGFQQLWMTLVSRRFSTFRDGLPRECERCDRRFERLLRRLQADARGGTEEEETLATLLAETRAGMARLHRLREPANLLPAVV